MTESGRGHDRGRRCAPGPAAGRAFLATGRTTLGLDLGSPWPLAERVAAYVAAHVNFPMEEPWTAGEKDRAAVVLQEAANHGEHFLALPESANAELCMALSQHLRGVADMLVGLHLVDRAAFDAAMTTARLLADVAKSPSGTPSHAPASEVSGTTNREVERLPSRSNDLAEPVLHLRPPTDDGCTADVVMRETSETSEDDDELDDQEAERIWGLAYGFFLGSDVRVAANFFRRAREGFEELLEDGQLQDGDRLLFFRGWAIHNLAFVEAYPYTLDEVEEPSEGEGNAQPIDLNETIQPAAFVVPPEAAGSGDTHTEEEKDKIWDCAYWGVCETYGDEAVYFYRPASREFDRLRQEGHVREPYRGLFLRAWAAHSIKLVEEHPDLLLTTSQPMANLADSAPAAKA